MMHKVGKIAVVCLVLLQHVYAFDFTNLHAELDELILQEDACLIQQRLEEAMKTLSVDESNQIDYDAFYESSTAQSPDSLWGSYMKLVRAFSVKKGQGSGSEDLVLSEKGYIKGSFSSLTHSRLCTSLSSAKHIFKLVSDRHPHYYNVSYSVEDEERDNLNTAYFLLEQKQMTHIRAVLDELNDEVSISIGSPWRVVNTCAWQGRSESKVIDSFPKDVYKLMIFAKSESKQGSWILYKPDVILDPGFIREKDFVIEVTLAPSPQSDTTPVQAGLLALYPHRPWFNLAHKNALHIKTTGGEGLNIGGGRNTRYPGWINLDAATDGSRESFILSPHCHFSLDDKSIVTAYSSHVFEHLDDATVSRVLSETHRVLMDDGYFIIKIPYFDEILEAWRAHDEVFFSHDYWGFPTNLWANLGVSDCLDTRAAFLFSSFGSPELNGLFSGHENLNHPRAYYGPPLVSPAYLRSLMQEKQTPHSIAAQLRKQILLESGGNTDFGHQNAWSRSELKDLLQSFGFTDIIFGRDEVLAKWGHINLIRSPWEMSTWCMARKPKSS